MYVSVDPLLDSEDRRSWKEYRYEEICVPGRWTEAFLALGWLEFASQMKNCTEKAEGRCQFEQLVSTLFKTSMLINDDTWSDHDLCGT